MQVELSRGVSPRSRARELLVRLRALIRQHRGRWLGLLTTHAPDSVFERGFVEAVRLSGATLLLHGPAVFDEHPIHRLSLHSVPIPRWPDVAGSPCLGCLTALDLRDNPDGDALGVLGDSPHLGRLRALDVHSTRLTAKGLAESARRRPRRPGAADPRRQPTGAGGRRGAGRVTQLPLLRELDLASAGITDAAAWRWPARPGWRGCGRCGSRPIR